MQSQFRKGLLYIFADRTLFKMAIYIQWDLNEHLKS